MSVSISFVWHTQKDDRVCPICRDIDNYVFGPYPEVPDEFVHPKWGVVWNRGMGSFAHEIHLHRGSKYGLIARCRCNLEPKPDFKELIRLLKKKLEEFNGEITEAPDYQSGGQRTTSFEDIGIDPSKYGLEE